MHYHPTCGRPRVAVVLAVTAAAAAFCILAIALTGSPGACPSAATSVASFSLWIVFCAILAARLWIDAANERAAELAPNDPPRFGEGVTATGDVVATVSFIFHLLATIICAVIVGSGAEEAVCWTQRCADCPPLTLCIACVVPTVLQVLTAVGFCVVAMFPQSVAPA